VLSEQERAAAAVLEEKERGEDNVQGVLHGDGVGSSSNNNNTIGNMWGSVPKRSRQHSKRKVASLGRGSSLGVHHPKVGWMAGEFLCVCVCVLLFVFFFLIIVIIQSETRGKGGVDILRLTVGDAFALSEPKAIGCGRGDR
jgi:hypothetical protein